MALRNKSRLKHSGSRIAAVAFLIVIVGAVAGYYLLSPSKKTDRAQLNQDVTTDKPGISSSSVPKLPTVPPPAHKEPDTQSLPVNETRVNETQKNRPVSGLLAIIIDDMGNSLSEARSLAAIKVPLTFAIIPGLRVDKEVAAYAAANDIETMIHIPMQSKEWPKRRLETNGFLVSMDAGELQERMSVFLKLFPGAVGANNHMGSEFTEHEEKMAVVLQTLKNSKLFFIDSVTSPDSTGLRVARRLGIRSARRNVFLDNEQERGYIIGQLNQAVRLAKKNGSAIAICHPHPATLAALAAALPALEGQGVNLVPASQLVNQ